MSKDELTAVLGGWEGYTLGTVGRFEAGQEGRTRAEVHLELLPIRDHPRVCSGCGNACRAIHDTAERWVDDLPILGADTRLLMHRVRVACPACGGPKLERLAWLEPYARVTVRLAESVARLCRVLPVRHVADYFALDWKTVKPSGSTRRTSPARSARSRTSTASPGWRWTSSRSKKGTAMPRW